MSSNFCVVTCHVSFGRLLKLSALVVKLNVNCISRVKVFAVIILLFSVFV